MALLGVIHRTMLGKGPAQFLDFFQRDPSQHGKVLDPRRLSKSPLIKRSALGLVAIYIYIYNMFPLNLVAEKSISFFQRELQNVMITYAASGHPQWSEIFSPRLPLASHPLATIF